MSMLVCGRAMSVLKECRSELAKTPALAMNVTFRVTAMTARVS